MNTLFLDALNCENGSGRPPIWLMRQAGRYMPEYQALKAKYSFLEMCHQPELAAQVTRLPIDTFGMDAAILFSDILVIPEALGVGLRFEEGAGPIIDRPIATDADITALPSIDAPEKLGFVAEAIKLLKTDLKVPLIGFCGAPFTLASYMIEGKTSRTLDKTKRWMFRDPASFHRLLDTLADHCIAYLKMQIAAGVDAIQIFDSWANVLGHSQFREFSLKYLEKILRGIDTTNTPVILFCRGSSVFAKDMVEALPAGISLDWNVKMSQMRKAIPQTIALQGNLDPDILRAPIPVIRREARALLDTMQGEPGYIFNLGHGVFPDVSPDAVHALVDEVKG